MVKKPFFNGKRKKNPLTYRSGLEEKVAEELRNSGVAFAYEPASIPFTQPEKKRRYTPDFLLPNGIIIETKGMFDVDDRTKHLLLKEEYPEMDLRFVFTNPNTKISKSSKTSYADWCDKHGFLYAKKSIPPEWLKEVHTIKRAKKCPLDVREFIKESGCRNEDKKGQRT